MREITKPMFNDSIKNAFLNSASDKLYARLHATFSHSYILESMYDKDLYEFNLTEIEELFRTSKIKKATNRYSDIRYYLDYCKVKGLIKENIMLA